MCKHEQIQDNQDDCVKKSTKADSRLGKIFLLYELYHGMGWDQTGFAFINRFDTLVLI